MAAGRCGVVRRGVGFNYLKKEYDYCRGRDGGDRIPTKGDGDRRGGFNGWIEEREACVVLNESRSEDAVAYESRVGYCNVSKVEHGEQLSRDGKRKFSPIIWDRKVESTALKNKLVKSSIGSFPPVSLPSFASKVPNTCSDAGVPLYLVVANQLQGPQVSCAKICVSHRSFESALSDSPDKFSLLASQESYGNKKQKLDPMEDDGIDKGYNISSSRWASEDDSLDVYSPNDEFMPQSRVLTCHLDSSECEEFLRESSEGNRARLSGSDEGSCLSGPDHGRECPDYESGNSDFMEIEKVRNDDVDYNSNDGVKGIQDSMASMQGRINMLQSCRSVFEYDRLNKINEGAYGVVYRARDKKTGEIMALKKVKMGREAEREGSPISSLREINILLSFNHPAVVGVKEVVVDEGDGIFMAMEYMEHDLKGLNEKMGQPFSTSEVKCLMKQLLEGVKYLHENWVIHRDLKTSNLLLNNRGELKICDFGLSRLYGTPLKPYTSLVVTLWYRAPELLLGKKQYSTAIDMWSVGCIMAELLAKKPLFQGETEIDQLGKIFRVLGTPNDTIWPGFSELPGSKANFVKQQYNTLRKIFPATSFTGSPVLSDSGFDLLSKLLTFDPDKRITAEDALNHDWFHEVPLSKSKDFMPTFPVQHCQDRHTGHVLAEIIALLVMLIYWMLCPQQCHG